MFEKLQADYQRFLDIEQALLDPEVTSDVRQVRALSKERGSLAKLALGYGRYLDLGRQISEAEEVCEHEADPEMRSYAEGRACRHCGQRRRLRVSPCGTCFTTERRVRCTQPSSSRFAPAPVATKRPVRP